ncbi:MAG: 2-phosphosulfolactate phosphatase [Bacteroidales bacterium]|nr:2-phosphosulfolactate phosphatase [Bacteroidales bacterium]MCB9013778.1 2-phosphosulfolactate phosphatase [Bacteroidales bacterium]
MNISILQMIEGAREAKGLTVIIDVFRAFSLACYAFDRGADRIIPVGDIKLAYALKEANPDYILIGERNENKMPGFDFGNSPTHILNEDFRGKTLVHTTSAGTQGLVNAINASEILTGSFVNAGAIVNYIRSSNPNEVSLVCMGYSAQRETEEDNFCAEYIKNELEDRENNFEFSKRVIRETSGRRFFEDGKQEFSPSSDFELCLELSRFSFVIRAEKSENGLILKKVNQK